MGNPSDMLILDIRGRSAKKGTDSPEPDFVGTLSNQSFVFRPSARGLRYLGACMKLSIKAQRDG